MFQAYVRYFGGILLGIAAFTPISLRAQSWTLKVMVDTPPVQLNPRQTIDATGQRLGALLYRGLVRLDEDLNPVPDFAESWEVSPDGKTYWFWLRDRLADQKGNAVQVSDMVACLEQYRVGKPTSILKSSFPAWQKTQLSKKGNRPVIEFTLNSPDPYLLRNLTLLRYFKTTDSQIPCQEAAQAKNLIGSGMYQITQWDSVNQSQMSLKATDPALPNLEIFFVKDEIARAVALLRNDVDLTLNGISLAKTQWLQKNHSDQFEFYHRPGVNVSYLAFNLRDSVLAQQKVRRAIAHAIDRNLIVSEKWFGLGQVAQSFLLPALAPKVESIDLEFDPKKSMELLDQAGFKPGKNGIRLTLKYKTTPFREGYETALIFRDMLKKVGVHLLIEVVEPATFQASIQKGSFQLYSSRWVGVADAGILYRSMRSAQPLNRVGYNDPGMDHWLDLLSTEMNPQKRAQLLTQVYKKMGEDLPYFPLWFWTNSLIVQKSIAPVFKSKKLSLSGALDTLLYSTK